MRTLSGRLLFFGVGVVLAAVAGAAALVDRAGGADSSSTAASSTTTTTVPLPACPANTSPRPASLDVGSAPSEFTLRWGGLPCAFGHFSVVSTLYAFPDWVPGADVSDAVLSDVVGTSSATLTSTDGMGAAGLSQRFSYTAAVPTDNPYPLVVEIRLGLSGSVQVDRYFSALVCPNRAGYASTISGAALIGGSATAAQLAGYLTAFAAACPDEGSSFEPQVTISVPLGAAHVGRYFDVSFARSSGPETGCSATSSHRYKVGSVSAVAPVSQPSLVDRPAGSAGRCVYEVTYATNEVGGASLVLDEEADDFDDATGGADPAAGASYSASTSEPAGCSTAAPVGNLRDTTSGDSLNRAYVWDRPAHWGGRTCAGVRGYHVAVQEFKSVGLAAALDDSAVDTWAVASSLVRREPSGGIDRFHDEASPTAVARSVTNWIGRDQAEVTWHVLDVYTYNASLGSGHNARFGGHRWLHSKIVCPRSAPNGQRLTSIAAPSGDAKNVEWLNGLRAACGFETSFKPQVTITVANGTAFDGKEIDVAFVRSGGPATGCTQDTTHTYAVQSDGTVTAAALRLIDRPENSAERCEYEVSFPPNDNGYAAALALDAGTPTDTTTSAAESAASATYEASRPTYLFPDVRMTPHTDRLQIGKRFVVSFSRASGPTQGCTSGSVVYPVQSDGVAYLSEALRPRLIDRPAGQSERCIYTVGFPQHERGSQALLVLASDAADFDNTVSANDLQATASYLPTYPNRYTPDIRITVPPGFAGVWFTVGFTRTSGPADRCPVPSPYNFQVNSRGSVVASGHRGPLVGRPARSFEVCEYRANFRNHENGTTRLVRALDYADFDDTVNATERTAKARYLPNTTTDFAPDVNITIDPTPASDANHTFGLTFAQSSGPTAGCSPETRTTYRYVSTESTEAITSLQLVDRPAGYIQRCEYQVTFPTNESGDDEALIIDKTQGYDNTTSGAGRTATASYLHTSPVNFTPNINISIDAPSRTSPSDAFDIRFAHIGGPATGCTDEDTHYRYSVASDGTLTSPTVEMVGWPASTREPCEYQVEFPTHEVSGTQLKLDRQQDFDNTSSGASKSAGATYLWNADQHFTPDVRLTVDPAPGGSSTHAFSLRFVRRSGPLIGCSDTRAHYRVSSAGSSLVAALQLVDRPAASRVSCEYRVVFPTIDTGGTTLVLDQSRGFDDTTSNASTTASATYLGATSFTPEVAISVDPAPAAGTTYDFSLSFLRSGGPLTGCSPRTTATYRYVSATSTVPVGPLSLIDRPEGSVGRCVYRVSYPTNEVGSDAGLVVKHVADATTSGSSKGTSVTYRSGPMYFTPTVQISVQPPIVGRYTSMTFEVDFERLRGPASGCSAPTDRIYRFLSQRSAQSTLPLKLINQPAGSTSQCVYRVTFPPTEVGDTTLQRQEGLGSQYEIRATSPIAVGLYRSLRTYFRPTVTISVEPTPADDVRYDFTLTFTPRAGSSSDCSVSTDETYRYRRGRTALELTQFELIDRPYRDSARCVYDVEFATNEIGGNNVLRRSRVTGASVDGHTRAAAATYVIGDTHFRPTIIIVPANGHGPFTDGLQFQVTFTRVGGPTYGCTPAFTRTYDMEPEGFTSGPEHQQMVDQPPGTTEHCEYLAFYHTHQVRPSTQTRPTWRYRHSAAGTVISAANPTARGVYHYFA